MVQWDILVKEMEETNKTLAGDVFVSSACVAYLGAFTAPFRLEMVTKWVDLCRERGMVVSDPFSLVKTLATPVQMREWAIMTLPTDQMSLVCLRPCAPVRLRARACQSVCPWPGPPCTLSGCTGSSHS